MPPPRLDAYVDESVHTGAGLYVLAAVLGRAADRETVHRALTAVTPGGAPPHWGGEADPVRQKLADTVAGLPVEARVYACRFAVPRRAEAARARALRWLLLELDPGVGELVLDRRDAAQDAIDRRVLTTLAGRPATAVPPRGVRHRAVPVGGGRGRRRGLGFLAARPGLPHRTPGPGAVRRRAGARMSAKAGPPSSGGDPGLTSGP